MKKIEGLLIILAAALLTCMLTHLLMASDDKAPSGNKPTDVSPPSVPPKITENQPVPEGEDAGKDEKQLLKTEPEKETATKKPETKPTTIPTVTKTTTTKEEPPLEFDFRNTDIQQIVKYFATHVNKNFIIPKTLVGNVTIITGRPISKSRAFDVLETILDSQGYSMFEDEFFIRIEKHGTPQHKSRPTENILFIKGENIDVEKRDKIITAIIVLQYISTLEITPVLNSIRSPSALVFPFQRINALFLRDTERNLDYLVSIVQKLDQPGTSGMITIHKLRYSPAGDISAILNQVVAAQGISVIGVPPTPTAKVPGRGAARIMIIADRRTNNLIIIATEKETEALLALILELDVPPEQVDVSIHTFQCNNQKAKDLATILGQFVDKRPSVTQPKGAPPLPGITQLEFFFIADETTNTLIVQAPPQEWPFYRDLLRQLDQPQRQVLIEVWIVEVSSDNEKTLGVEIMPSDLPPNERTGPLQNEIYPISKHTISSLSGIFGGTTGDTTGQTGAATGIGATIGIRTLTATEISIDGRKIRIPNFDVFLRAVKGNTDVKILSSPKLVTLNNKKATVTITDEISIRTSEITNIETTGGVSTATYNRKEVGISLGIEPQINADDFVIMDLTLEVSNVVGEVSTDPTISKRSTESSVRCENKQTIVISGLRRNNSTKSKTGVPILGDIPLLGKLFSTTTTTNINTNLLIFITPHIITETSDMLVMTDYIKHQRLSEEEKRFVITGKKEKGKAEKKSKVIWNR